MTNIIYEENEEKINPIRDKKIAKEIQKEFNEIAKKYVDVIGDYGMQIIYSKINDINRPTNSKKLSMPFEIFKIKLSKEDLEILNHRNKFLHGTSPFTDDDLKNKEYELKFIVAKLENMLNILMLKYIGYTGHIVNYTVEIQQKFQKEITENKFILI